ncbi:hypothetical protein BG28_09780 [Nesterenkonia sp. AN1]|uniref:hypothetical protein n=1 Tax=Nesterenkonia sp. AN1 TaxID=652017 RepID=UPI000452482F|nr:hypothetical protein [Nesterenkonia sp. AN1]EXF23878.1 hypothetical protein BG28_09780 [Nesterenkonia sp. AN1]
MESPPLIVADYRADQIYALSDSVFTTLGHGVLAEHAGVLDLPPHRESGRGWAFVDDRRGVLVRYSDGKFQEISTAIPGEHLARDVTGRYVIAATGLGANHEAWSDVVTVHDLEASESVRFRSRVGEPGVLVTSDQSTGEPMIVLRHREPGSIEAVPLCRALSVGAHVPVLRGETTTDIAEDGHGDVVDHHTGILATATSRGLERFVIDKGVPRSIGIVAWPVMGRAFYLRFDPNTGSALGVLRGGPTAPTAWTDWTNYFVEIDLSTGQTRHTELPKGLAFRFALGGETTAVTTIHPDGDQLSILDRDAETLQLRHHVPLPAMSHPPSPGHLPWDPVGDSPAQRRAVAVDPTGQTVAVTAGGDARLHLITADDIETLTTPSALDEGGVLFWTHNTTDSVGR